MRSSFFGAVSSGSGHRSVGYHRPCGRRRSETKSSGRGPWDVGLCVVRVSRRDAVSGKNRAVGREIRQGPSQPPGLARAGVGRGNQRARSGPMPARHNFPSLAVLGARRIVCGRLFGAQASRAKWSSPTTSGPAFRCPPAAHHSYRSSRGQRNKLSISIIYIA